MTDLLPKDLCTYMITFVTDFVMYNLATNTLMLVINFFLHLLLVMKSSIKFFVATLF